MPSLVLFGQKVCFAGDDLRTLSLTIAALRLLQLCLGISVLSLTLKQNRRHDDVIDDLEECELEGMLSPLASKGIAILVSYSLFVVALSITGLATSIPMYIVSGKGTPTDAEPRQPLYCLCYVNLTLLNFIRVPAFLFGVLATLVLVDYCDCLETNFEEIGVVELREACPESGAWIGAMVTLNATIGIDAVLASVVCACFTCHLVSPSIPTVAAPERKWQVCCRCCVGFCSAMTCCIFGGAEAVMGDFGDFAVALHNLLYSEGKLDVTPSDIVVGLQMVSRTQRAETLKTRESVQKVISGEITDKSSSVRQGSTRSSSASRINFKHSDDDANQSRKSPLRAMSSPSMASLDEGDGEDVVVSKVKLLSRRNTRDVFCMAEAARFMPYAESTYTWVMYLMEYPFTALCRLAFLIVRQCACFRSFDGKIAGDFFWKAHTISLEQISGLAEEDIVYASFRQGIKETPYLIALDHEWKTVALVVRGTLSFESLLADITLKSVELNTIGQDLGFEGRGHFCHAGMLACSEWIYRDLERHGKLDALFKGEYSNYRLRICGHSLGAGCATILGLFLRPRYPNLRCLAFSPPGCVLSKELAEECAQWQTSYLLDADIVPRLSIESFETLRDELLETICRIKIPKYQIAPNTRQELKTRDALIEANAAVLCDPTEPHDSAFKQQVAEFLEFQANLKAQKQSSFERLYPPGEIIQLFRTWDKSSLRQLASDETGRKPQEYTARWIGRSDLEKILLSTHLLFDHDPVQVKRKLQDFAEGFDLDPPYTGVLGSRPH